jgi:hypothetical protein
MFQAIVNILMESYVNTIDDPIKLPLKIARQFNADTGKFNLFTLIIKSLVFLLDALQDLRVEPLPKLTILAEKLAEISTRQQ